MQTYEGWKDRGPVWSFSAEIVAGTAQTIAAWQTLFSEVPAQNAVTGETVSGVDAWNERFVSGLGLFSAGTIRVVPGPSVLRAGADVSMTVRRASVEDFVARGGGQSSKQAADLSRHLGYAEKYGAGGVTQLENGRFRYYGEVQPANKAGEMAGRRYVHEFDPASGGTRGWHETVDLAGTVRQVRPELNNGTKKHYRFDSNGNYAGSW